MDDEHTRDLPRLIGRMHEVALDVLVAIWRLNGGDFGLDSAVVFGNLLRPGVMGPQALPNRHGGHASNGELLRSGEEFAPIYLTMNVGVEKVEKLLRIFAGGFTFHVRNLLRIWIPAISTAFRHVPAAPHLPAGNTANMAALLWGTSGLEGGSSVSSIFYRAAWGRSCTAM